MSKHVFGTWYSTKTDPPDVAKGNSRSVIVAFHNGRYWERFGADYHNHTLLYDDSEEDNEGDCFTGFAEYLRDEDENITPIDPTFWMPMPPGPENTP